MPNENSFQADLIAELREDYPEWIILKNDPNYLQGFPDILILAGPKWAALETKKEKNSRRRPNQEYYVQLLGEMSFARFIEPENKEEVLYDLQEALRA